MLTAPPSPSLRSLLLSISFTLGLLGCADQAPSTSAADRRPSQAGGQLIAGAAAMEHYGSCGFVCHCSAFSDGTADVLHFGCGGQLGVAECDAQPVVTVPARFAISSTVCNQRVRVCLTGTDNCIDATVMDTGPRNWEGNTFLFNALGLQPTDGSWAYRDGACLAGEFAGNTGHCCTYGGGATTVDIYQIPVGPVPTTDACAGGVPYDGYACDGQSLRRCEGQLDGVDRWETLACLDHEHCATGLTDVSGNRRGGTLAGGCCVPAGEDLFLRFCRDPASETLIAMSEDPPLHADGEACGRDLECLSNVCGCDATHGSAICLGLGAIETACARTDRAPCTPGASTCASGGSCGCDAQSPDRPVCLPSAVSPKRCSGEPCSPISPPCAGGCACEGHPQAIVLAGTCQAGAQTCDWSGVSPQACVSSASCPGWGGRCGCIDGQYRCLPPTAFSTENCAIHARKALREPCGHHDECRSGVCGGCWVPHAGGPINAWKVCLPTSLHGSTAPGACGQPGHRCDPSLPGPQCAAGGCSCLDTLGESTCC